VPEGKLPGYGAAKRKCRQDASCSFLSAFLAPKIYQKREKLWTLSPSGLDIISRLVYTIYIVMRLGVFAPDS
jgi:hypothetical protein